MIFSIQHFLEDYFHHRNLSDVDQYAVKLANLYALRRKGKTGADFLKAMSRLQTVFYRNNSHLNRASLERDMLLHLDRRFKKNFQTPVNWNSRAGSLQSARNCASFRAVQLLSFYGYSSTLWSRAQLTRSGAPAPQVGYDLGPKKSLRACFHSSLWGFCRTDAGTY